MFAIGVPSVAIATTLMTAGFVGFSVNSFNESRQLKNYQRQLEKFEEQSNKYVNYLNSEKQWIKTTKSELAKLQNAEGSTGSSFLRKRVDLMDKK